MISIANTATRTLMMRKSVTTIGRRCLSVQGEEAVGRLKDALEQYRAANYQQTIPTRFKKEMISCAANNRIPSPTAKDDKMVAVEGIENLLQNIGVFGKQVTHDDVETIVSELGAEEADAVRADKILSKIL